MNESRLEYFGFEEVLSAKYSPQLVELPETIKFSTNEILKTVQGIYISPESIKASDKKRLKGFSISWPFVPCLKWQSPVELFQKLHFHLYPKNTWQFPEKFCFLVFSNYKCSRNVKYFDIQVIIYSSTTFYLGLEFFSKLLTVWGSPNEMFDVKSLKHEVVKNLFYNMPIIDRYNGYSRRYTIDDLEAEKRAVFELNNLPI
jgi:hypothetical protein